VCRAHFATAQALGIQRLGALHVALDAREVAQPVERVGGVTGDTCLPASAETAFKPHLRGGIVRLVVGDHTQVPNRC
jgi:hypothetical protein